MNGVDSSFEAIAFIPVNLSPLLSAACNNLWAWVALLTAVFSFWRLRTSSPKTTSSHISIPPPPTTTTTKTTSFKVIDEQKRDKDDENDEEQVVLTRGTHHSEKFFTVYYENDDDDQMDGDDHDDADADDDNDECVVIKRWGSTGSTVEMISSSSSSYSEFDLGWYSYQDRKVIDGSVVRLWGEERESSGCGNASPRGCRRRSFIGVTQLALA